MRIKQVVSQHRNDFTAIMICEHCSHEWRNAAGYDDAYYHGEVIPDMHCKECGKNRAGDLPKEPTTPTAKGE